MSTEQIEVIPLEPKRILKTRILGRAKVFVSKTRKQVEIKALQAAEKYLRARSLRLLMCQGVGAYAAFYGVEMYSHRVAWILLGAGILFAVERQ